jgi:hypothetical protein
MKQVFGDGALGLWLAILILLPARPALALGAQPTGAPTGAEALVAMPGRPDPGAGPTVVRVGTYVIAVTALDEQSQTFTGDFYVWFTWVDPRLADPRATGLRTASLDAIWHPHALVVNRRQTTLANPRVVQVDPAGTVVHAQRLTGTFAVPLALRGYPRDRQQLEMEIVAPGFTPDEVRFEVDEDRVGREADLGLSGWRVGDPELRPFVKELVTLKGKTVVRLPGMRMGLEAARNWHYYALREVLPLVFIVLMASALFWIPPMEHGLKVGISTAAIFSLMAFYGQLGRALPKIDYLTRMDWFIVGATILVFASFAQVIAGMYLVKRDALDTVRRMERWSRSIYPVTLAVITSLAFA